MNDYEKTEIGLSNALLKQFVVTQMCGSAKNLPLPLPHRLFDFAKKFCLFLNVDYTVKLHYKS